ncbi:MAG: polysaccharide biosynthesis protein [Clostridia bacterium]|nr:polysaccharide biosynthesis protein [Clostridia bacterium]
MRYLANKRRLTLIAIDVGTILATYVFVYLLRLLTGISDGGDVGKYALNMAVFALSVMAVRLIMKIYKNVWRYANSRVYLEMVMSDVIGGILGFLISLCIGTACYIGGWESVSVVAMLHSLTLISRFSYQQFYKKHALYDRDEMDNRITVAIAGAGQVGALLAEELESFSGSHYRPVCFIDSNAAKAGSRVAGLPVYMENDDTLELLHDFNVQEVIIAIPQLEGESAERILEYYGRLGCKVKIYDFPYREESEGEGKRVIREFNIEDLLFRKAIDVTDEGTKEFYRGKTVLITGGGGSIGSELARQVARCSPKKLIIFDIYENNAYDIEQELKKKYGDALDVSVEIGSVRDTRRLDAVFAYYRPEIVFHAAAHKHVPLMEHSNCEAIKNNCMGTYNTANVAEKYGVRKFILISTDKAVNPTNIMGASKRMCEMIVQSRDDSATTFSAVRFGNVLGSNGSVIPLFKRQIAMGGPVTVTDKRIIRYFMTIPEASGLVIAAGAMAKRGELFVLDMGKPVKIYDLAENMIKLSGLKPHTDIEIIETGLRPGEKLYEELLIKTETLEKTENDLIFVEHDAPLSREEVEEKLEILLRAVKAAEGEIAADSIREAMKSVVPTYYSPEEVNRTADESEEMKMTVTAL